MSKIAVIGDRESVVGFAAIGLETFILTDKSLAAKKLRELSKNNYSVVYITEAVAAEITDEIDKYKDSVTPAVILIPGVSGNTGNGMSSITQSVIRAVGSNIL